MKRFFSKIVIFLFLISLPLKTSALVVINEIAWMGTDASANNEWIELYNNTGKTVNLGGWILKAADGGPKINLKGIIPDGSFYLLERSDDDTLTEITADLIYKGALENKGERLELYDNRGNLIDEVNCSTGWFAGDNSRKLTMERINPLTSGNDFQNWQNSQNPGGTPKTENSKQETKKKKSPKSRGEQTETRFITTKPNYPAGIIFNEILPSPEGPDAENEWLELFNQNNFEVDLSGWTIKDKKGKITAYTFPQGNKISPLGFLVLKRPETKITLNNSGDGLELILPDGKVLDSVIFGKAPLGESYNKNSEGWFWSNNLTPGKENVISSLQQKKLSKKWENQLLPLTDEKETAFLGGKIPKTKSFESPSFFYILLIAFILAVLSALLIIILKKQLS